MRSPLRFPGGKNRLATYIVDTFFKNAKRVVSPFMGGGSVELELASRGVEVQAYDNCLPLVVFWNELKYDKDDLIKHIRSIPRPLTKEVFKYMQTLIKEESELSGPMLGAWFFALNRCSFSGTTLAGGMSPGTPRFTKASIDKLTEVDCTNLKVDFTTSYVEKLDKCKINYMTFLDPPYYVASRLYGDGKKKGTEFNHEELAEVLKNRKNWVLCYNDCPEIRALYANYEIHVPEYKYSMSKDKKSKDIIITG